MQLNNRFHSTRKTQCSVKISWVEEAESEAYIVLIKPSKNVVKLRFAIVVYDPQLPGKQDHQHHAKALE